MSKKDDEQAVSVKQFADEFNVSTDTVLLWVKSGKVKGSKKGPFPGRTSPILIPNSELERVKKLMELRSKS
jgi:transposase